MLTEGVYLNTAENLKYVLCSEDLSKYPFWLSTNDGILLGFDSLIEAFEEVVSE